jgi:hypothetical protein
MHWIFFFLWIVLSMTEAWCWDPYRFLIVLFEIQFFWDFMPMLAFYWYSQSRIGFSYLPHKRFLINGSCSHLYGLTSWSWFGPNNQYRPVQSLLHVLIEPQRPVKQLYVEFTEHVYIRSLASVLLAFGWGKLHRIYIWLITNGGKKNHSEFISAWVNTEKTSMLS